MPGGDFFAGFFGNQNTGGIGGVVGGFFIARQYMKNYFKENPPVNEDMIRTMMAQMGQKPKEAKVQQILRQMNSQSNQKK